jgi:hypothetical protein
MDLEEMKNTWVQLTSEMETQKKLTNKLILKMAHQKSSRSISNLKRFEMLGGLLMGVLLIIGTGYFLVTGAFQSVPLIICAIVSMALFVFSVSLSFIFILSMFKINLLENTIEKSQKYFKEFKETYKFNQAFGKYSTIPTMLLFIPVVLKISNDIDIFLDFGEGKTELIGILISSGLLAIPVLYVVIRFYKRNMRATTEAHEEIESK